MNGFYKFILLIALFQFFTQNVLSENATNLDSDDDINTKNANGRRSGSILVLDNSGKPADGQRITSHKVETKTYTTRITSGSTGHQGLHGWTSGSHSEGNVVLQPEVQGIVRTSETCGSGNNVVTNTGGQTSVVQKKSTLHTTQTFNNGGSGSMESLTSNGNQWQSGLKGLSVGSMTLEQLGGQSSLLHGTSSQITANKVNDMTDTIMTGNNHGVKSIYEGTDNNQKQEHILYPDNDSYKVSITSSGDGIYANELTGQQPQNLNVMVPTEANLQHIEAVPVTRPQFGQVTVQGYRPNIQYYLSQIETNHLLNNPSTLHRVPSFIEHIKPDQMNVNLSEDQLNSYKQYLTQTGLIKLKPYQLIFSDQFRPKLRTLQWMVVPVDSNAEFCKQRCGNLFARNTLYSTMTDHFSRLPLKLLVPVLKVRNGLKKTVTRMQAMAGAIPDIPGAFQLTKSSSSPVAGMEEKSDEKN